MKKILVILVALIGISLSANASNSDYIGTYCNEDGVELQLFSTGKFQIYIPGEGIRNGSYKIERESLTLDDGREPIYATIRVNVNDPNVSITGLKLLSKNRCK